MFVKIFSTAAFLVLSWLTMVSTDTRTIVHSVEGSSSTSDNNLTRHLQNNSVEQKELFKQVNDRLDEIINSKELAKSNNDNETAALVESKKLLSQKSKEVTKIKNLLTLREAYSIVLEAEVFSRAGNHKAAASSLLASKKAIYSTSGKLPKSKDKLRKLMGPIDSLASKWKSGDKSKSSLEIRKILKAEINANKI